MLPLNLCLPNHALADLHLSEWFDASWDRRGWSRKEAEVHGRRDRGCRRDACIRALVEVGDAHAVGHFDRIGKPWMDATDESVSRDSVERGECVESKKTKPSALLKNACNFFAQ